MSKITKEQVIEFLSNLTDDEICEIYNLVNKCPSCGAIVLGSGECYCSLKCWEEAKYIMFAYFAKDGNIKTSETEPEGEHTLWVEVCPSGQKRSQGYLGTDRGPLINAAMAALDEKYYS